MEILLIRHGEQLYPRDKEGRKLVSSPNAQLIDLGRLQIRQLREKFSAEGIALDATYTSPLIRAEQTRDVLTEGRDIPKYTIDNLKEISPNSSEGKTYDDLEKIEGDIYAHPFSSDQETLEHLVDRTREAIEFILSDARKCNYKTVGIIGHGDPLAALGWCLRNLNFPANYHEMRRHFYPQKGEAYEYIISDEEPFKLVSAGRTITTDAAKETIEVFRSSAK